MFLFSIHLISYASQYSADRSSFCIDTIAGLLLTLPTLKKSAIVKKIERIDELLAETYGVKKQVSFPDPTEELIQTILSQNTNDRNRDRAFNSLKKRFPRWEDAARARPGDIARAIKEGGLASIKSKRIKRILSQLRRESPDFAMTFLNRMSDGEAFDYLMRFDGVGPKTASCVLLFSLGRKSMPVDTHVHRVSLRLGLSSNGDSAEAVFEMYRELPLTVDVYQFHLNMIAHGRTLCRPARPACDQCPLTRSCRYFRERKR
jgi:endonuclease-3